MSNPVTKTVDLPPLLTGTEMYDMIMGQIEPMLCSDRKDALKVDIDASLPEERVEMAKYFEECFKEYEKQSAAYEKKWMEQFQNAKRSAMHSLEQEQKTKEDEVLSSLTKKMAA